MTPQEKQDNFKKELELLFKKYKAEMVLEQFGSGYITEEKIIIQFDFDEELFKEHNTGIVPDLVIGSYFS